ncbi:MAG: hypothetical protein KDK07_08985 [Bauldia sp.]|nr:hypothetical protein [Bauldia sp.]
MPVQTIDLFNISMPAIEYDAPGTTWTIARDVHVVSPHQTIHSLHDDSKLVNRGKILSLGNIPVAFDGASNLTVVNKAGGYIAGVFGIYFGGATASGALVKNAGEIFSASYGVFAQDTSDLVVQNKGSIIGLAAGVAALVGTPGATMGALIENSGTLRSQVYGVFSEMTPGLTTRVVNHADGTITGDLAAIIASEGGLVVKNEGLLVGDITAGGTDTNDKVVNKGTIRGDVHLGSGDDVFKSKDGKAGYVSGDEGNDTLIAGSKKDKLVFDTALDAANNVDRVKKFEVGKDKIFLDLDVFTALAGAGALADTAFRKGSTAGDADDRIIYDKQTGALYYDPDGNGIAPQVQFATLDKGLKLTAGDFTVLA